MARICVVGSWHQAMVVSASLADIGHRVHGVCDDEATAAALNAGRPVVHEAGLAGLLRRGLRRRTLRYGTDYLEGLAGAAFVFISIDTPVDANDESNLDSIVDVARLIGQYRNGDLALCVTAQVPVGTTERLGAIVRSGAGRGRCDIAYVPEFLRLGTALETFRKADRIVIGAERPEVATRVKALYRRLKRQVIVTDVRSAEMGKHASNAFLAASISFINEIADLSEGVGADAVRVAEILKADRRIGPAAFLSPGLGFAGGTLGRELQALKEIGRRQQCKTPLLDAVVEVNGARAAKVVAKMEQVLGTLQGRRLGILGLTYKPGTSTLRRAISLDIVRMLAERGAEVMAFDPLAEMGSLEERPRFERVDTVDEAATGSDGLILVTEWSGIQRVNWKQIRRQMRRPVFLDTRNLFDPVAMDRLGFEYLGIGRSAGDAATGSAKPRAVRREKAV